MNMRTIFPSMHTFAVNFFNSSAKGSICALTQFPNSRYFFFKITLFFQNHVIFKITLFFFRIACFSKLRYFFQNHVIFKITLFFFFQNHVIFKITLFFQNYVIFKITLFQELQDFQKHIILNYQFLHYKKG